MTFIPPAQFSELLHLLYIFSFNLLSDLHRDMVTELHDCLCFCFKYIPRLSRCPQWFCSCLYSVKIHFQRMRTWSWKQFEAKSSWMLFCSMWNQCLPVCNKPTVIMFQSAPSTPASDVLPGPTGTPRRNRPHNLYFVSTKFYFSWSEY